MTDEGQKYRQSPNVKKSLWARSGERWGTGEAGANADKDLTFWYEDKWRHKCCSNCCSDRACMRAFVCVCLCDEAVPS